MSGWEEKELGDVIELKRGYDLPAAQRHEGNVPIVSSSGRSGFHDEAKVRGPGVVTGRYGTLGAVYFLEEDFWPLNTALYVRNFKGNDPRFVAALLESLELGRNDGASAVPGVNRNHLHRLRVRVPEPSEQRKIGAVLKTLDELIANNHRRIELLEKMAKAVYREWFVYFRYPGHRDAAQVDSPLGCIPVGWTTHRLDEIAAVVRGRSYRKNELVEFGGVPFINLKCMQRGGGFRRDGLKRYDGAYSRDQQCHTGDIVLAVTDLTQAREVLAQATLVPRLPEGFGVISLDVVRVVPNEPGDRIPLFFSLLGSDFADRVKEYANGSTVLHLAPRHVGEGLLIWPEREIRSRFTETVAAQVAILDDLHEATDRISAIRKLLLPRLMTGRLDVSRLDLEAVLQNVVT